MRQRRAQRCRVRTYILVHEPLSQQGENETVVSESSKRNRVLVLLRGRSKADKKQVHPASMARLQEGQEHIYANRLSTDEEAFFIEAENAYQQEQQNHADDNALPDDGYDYEQHFRERGDGVFIPAPSSRTAALGNGPTDRGVRAPLEKHAVAELDQVLQMLASDDDLETSSVASEGLSSTLSDSASSDELADDFVLQANRDLEPSEEYAQRVYEHGEGRCPKRLVGSREARAKRIIDEQFDTLLQSTYGQVTGAQHALANNRTNESIDCRSEDVFESIIADFEQDLRKLRLDPTKTSQGACRFQPASNNIPSDAAHDGLEQAVAVGERCTQHLHSGTHADQLSPTGQPMNPSMGPETTCSERNEGISEDSETAGHDSESSTDTGSRDLWDDVASREQSGTDLNEVSAPLYRPQIIACPRRRFARRCHTRDSTGHGSEESHRFTADPNTILGCFQSGGRCALKDNEFTNHSNADRGGHDAIQTRPPNPMPSSEHSSTTKESASIARLHHKQAVKAFRRQRRASKKALREAYAREHARQTAHRHCLGAAKVSVHYNDAL
jgi:hypothetical protein